MIPREAAWLPSLVFVAFLAPARLLVGWAYARSGRRDRPRHWFFRVLGRLAIVLVAPFYVLVVFLSQYTSWGGVWSLYEQHAFLLPVPFLKCEPPARPCRHQREDRRVARSLKTATATIIDHHPPRREPRSGPSRGGRDNLGWPGQLVVPVAKRQEVLRAAGIAGRTRMSGSGHGLPGRTAAR